MSDARRHHDEIHAQACSAPVERVRSALESHGLPGRVRHLDEPVPTAADAARELGCEVGAIANSLVFKVGDGVILVLASGAHRVDVGKIARHLGVGRKKVRRADTDSVLAATGQAVGGVAPVGHPEPLPTIVDADLAAHPELWAGAGDHHSMARLTFDELVTITGGELLDVGEDERSS